MDQRRQWMKSGIFDEQRVIETKSYIFWAMQFAKNISKNKFQELLFKEVFENYIDNFIIPAKTKKELEKRKIWFLKVVEKHNLYFK